MHAVMDFSFSRPVDAQWTAMAAAIVESLIIWAAASWIFGRRDIAVSVE
jgi:hypothetical protein